MFEVVKRGKFCQLRTAGGAAVEIKLFGCTVVASKYTSGGKAYAKFDLSRARGRQELQRVSDFIDKAVKPRFSPLRFGFESVVAKLGGAKWETPEGAGFEFFLQPGAEVDLVVGPGGFGDYGWCVSVKRIKKAGSGFEDVSAWASPDRASPDRADRAPPSTPAGSP